MLRSALPLIVALLVPACGDQGTYELRWAIACQSGQATACPVKTAQDCADAGFDAVQVSAVEGSNRTRSLFPCFGPSGPVGEGPGLGAGTLSLEVAALSPGGQLIAGPVVVPASIPRTGVVTVDVTLPRPAACSDGVDNDKDGLVDRLDPECSPNGKYDPEGTKE